MYGPLAKPCFPWISASIPVRSRPFAGAREAFCTFAASVQFTHMHVPLLENLLRQHELLTAKVTVSSVRHGEGRGWGRDDGSKGRAGGRDVSGCPETGDNAAVTPPPPPPANIHLLPLLLTQIILQRNWVDYLPSQSVITSPPDLRCRPSTCLRSPAANSHMRRSSVRSRFSRPRSQWHVRDVPRSQEENLPGDIWSA